MRETLTGISLVLALIIAAIACKPSRTSDENMRSITDMLGRKVSIPENVERVVGVRAGALRMLVYLDAVEMLVGVEENEKKGLIPYTIANPSLTALPSIGPMMGGDSELILKARPDVIFTTYTTVADANALQQRTGIPVVAIECPEFGTEREVLFNSFRLMGNVLGKSERADTLINYIEESIAYLDITTRVVGSSGNQKVYVGGISYSGSFGISSTQAYYPPFVFANATNVAAEISPQLVSHVKGTFVDVEQLLVWNPDILFVDHSGLELTLKDIKEKPVLRKNINALKNSEVYTMYAYNNYATNYEMVLANAWYAAKVIYPGQFEHIDMEDKVNEISKMFLGMPVYDELIVISGAYSHINIENQ